MTGIPQAPRTQVRPSLGRIIHILRNGEVHPGVIVHVHDDSSTINVAYWDMYGQSHPMLDVRFSMKPATEDSTWFWPPMAMTKEVAEAIFGKDAVAAGARESIGPKSI